MEERVTWEKAEVALDGTKEKQERNANDGHGKKGFHGIRAPAEKRTRRGSRTFEKYPSFIRLHERVIFDITSPPTVSIVSPAAFTFRAKSGCINAPVATIHPFLGTSKVDNVHVEVVHKCEQTHRYLHHRVRSRRWIM